MPPSDPLSLHTSHIAHFSHAVPWLKISKSLFHAISVLAMWCWPITVPLAKIPILPPFYICLWIYISREWEKLDWHRLNAAFLWTCGLLAFPHSSMLAGSCCCSAQGRGAQKCQPFSPACSPQFVPSLRLFQTLSTNHSQSLPSCFPWLLSVTTSLMRCAGFHLHQDVPCFGQVWCLAMSNLWDSWGGSAGSGPEEGPLRSDISCFSWLPSWKCNKKAPAGLMSRDRDPSAPGPPKTSHNLSGGKALPSQAKFVLSPQLQTFACCSSLFVVCGGNAPLNLMQIFKPVLKFGIWLCPSLHGRKNFPVSS